jgi:uncharacterized membrane protein YfcA
VSAWVFGYRERLAGVSTWALLGMLLSVFLAAATQRITGIGFALVSAPLLVLVSGPITGVLLANLLSLITSLIVLTQTWRQVDLKRVVLLTIPALCCLPVGLFVARHLPPAALMVGIGGLVLAALAAVRLLRRTAVFSGPGGAIAAGALSGFMNVTAGVGGPAVTLYAIGSRWPHYSFVGSAQLYFAILNIGSITAKGLPHIGAVALAGAVGALGLGVLLGHFAARRIAPGRARAAVLVLAVAGAMGTVIKGLFLGLQ